MPSLADAFLRDGLANSCVESDSLQRDVYVAIRRDGQFGSGTEDDPYDGSGFGFDQVMLQLSTQNPPITQSVVHLGPGTFLTKGSVLAQWAPLSGQRIFGSGMFATSLKLQLTATPNTSTEPESAVFQRINELNGYEISDLTFDCNLEGQPHTHSNNVDDGCARIATRAVYLLGQDILIRRVRVTNWGTQSATRECFPIGIGGPLNPEGGPRVRNCVIERCVVERPGFNNLTMTTCLQLHSGQWIIGIPPSVALGKTDHPQDCVIRDNFINCELVASEKTVLNVTSLEESEEDGIAELTTATSHNREVGDWIVVAGALVNSAWSQRFNGAFEVLSVNGSSLTYQMNGAPVEQGHPDTMAGIKCEYLRTDKPSLKVKVLTHSGTTATLETYEWHGRTATPEDWIVVSGVVVNGSTNNPFNGSFRVSTVDQQNSRLTYVMADTPANDPDTMAGVWLGKAPVHHACIRSIVKTNDEVTLTTVSPHYRRPGDFVTVSGVYLSATELSDWNGHYQIKSVLNPTQLKFDRTDTPSGEVRLGVASIGAVFQGMSASGLVERNRVFHCQVGGTYHDWWCGRRTVVRKNYYFDVYRAVFENMGTTEQLAFGATGALGGSVNVTTRTFALDPAKPFGYEPGDIIQFTYVNPTRVYFVVVEANASPSSFTFVGTAETGSGVSATRVWQKDELLVEDNVIDLALRSPYDHQTGAGQYIIGPSAINIQSSTAQLANFPWVFQRVIIRNNLIRHVGGAADPEATTLKNTRAIDVSSAKSLIVEGNIIDVEDPATWGVRYIKCGRVKALNNLTSDGKLIQAGQWWLEDPNKLIHDDEIQTLADAALLAL